MEMVIIKRVYLIICILSTIILICYGIFQYLLDQDTARITFRNFHKDFESIYPATTICFGDPLDDEKFHNRSQKRHYEHYLAGRGDATMVDGIDYDEVSKAFHDHLLKVYIVLNNYTTLTYNITSSNKNLWMGRGWHPNLYISRRSSYHKCWTFEIPVLLNESIIKYGIIFKSTMFPKRIRPRNQGFNVTMNYPGQYLTNRLRKTHWDVRNDRLYQNKKRTLTMKFNIQNIVVLKLRNKRKKPCNTEWENNDKYILGEMAKEIGCKPPHWKIETKLPTCTSRQQMKKAHEVFDQSGEEDFTPPCRRLEKVVYSYADIAELGHEFPHTNNTEIVYQILVEFEGSTYMEVEHVREISFHSMAGNAGGYVGLFLGWALAHLPDSIEKGLLLLNTLSKTKPLSIKPIDNA